MNNRIQIFDENFKFLRKFRGQVGDELINPSYVCIDQNGKIAVCDTGNHRVVIFSSEGEVLCKFGKKGNGSDGEWLFPRGIALDMYGNIVVTDWENERIVIYGQA